MNFEEEVSCSRWHPPCPNDRNDAASGRLDWREEMPRLIVFENVTLDGYFAGPDGDLSWSHNQEKDPEWDKFVADNASGGGQLLLGRKTYDLMASYWPTPRAAQNDPEVAKGMNSLPKVVFSRTLDNPTWSNTTVKSGDLADEVRKMKKGSGRDIAVLGSGSIVSQLAKEGLVDEYQIVVHPVVLGKGRTAFEGVPKKLDLKRTKARTFNNGNVLTCWEPAA
jgi:dihydrofolate reductase